jgi:hypothetical protein
VLRFLLIRANKSLRVAETSSQADDANISLVGNSNVAKGDFEYML